MSHKYWFTDKILPSWQYHRDAVCYIFNVLWLEDWRIPLLYSEETLLHREMFSIVKLKWMKIWTPVCTWRDRSSHPLSKIFSWENLTNLFCPTQRFSMTKVIWAWRIMWAEVRQPQLKKNIMLNIAIIVGEYLESKGDLIEKIDKTRWEQPWVLLKLITNVFSKIHPDILSDLKQSGLFGLTIPTKVMMICVFTQE